METIAIDNRNEFALWAIERAHAIVSDQGTALALAARESGEDAIREAGNAARQGNYTRALRSL